VKPWQASGKGRRYLNDQTFDPFEPSTDNTLLNGSTAPHQWIHINVQTHRPKVAISKHKPITRKKVHYNVYRNPPQTLMNV